MELHILMFFILIVLFVFYYLVFSNIINPYINSPTGYFFIVVFVVLFSLKDISMGVIMTIIFILILYDINFNKERNYKSFNHLNIFQTESARFEGLETMDDSPGSHESVKKEFVKKNCNINKQLVTKKDNNILPLSLISTVYPEVEFHNNIVCSPCDKTCKFSIIQNKITTEKQLMIPKNSNDYVQYITSNKDNYDVLPYKYDTATGTAATTTA